MNDAMLFSPAMRRVLSLGTMLAMGVLTSCGTNTSAAGSSTTTTTTNAYATAYKSMTWASGVTVTFPTSCSMTVSASGQPYTHAAYYLAPVMTGGTVVATTPSGIQLGLISASGLLSNDNKVTATFNICPTKATSTTATSGGSIGLIGAGTALFDPYEATATVALSDNASYTFTQNGTTYTASFLDTCNQHTTGGAGGGGSTWHFHGNPTCWTSVVDGATGPSHIIGIALDGFPIYGGRDINGNVVSVASLDACNGITSATPEFPSGAYHYVLPIDSNGNAITTKQSSLNCYAGTVSATLSAQMKTLGCKMPMLLASGKMRLPDGREVSKAEAEAWMQQTMPGMKMGNAAPVLASGAGAKKPMEMAGMKHDGMMNMPGM